MILEIPDLISWGIALLIAIYCFYTGTKGSHSCNLNWWCDACKKIYCPDCAPVPKCPGCGGTLMHDD